MSKAKRKPVNQSSAGRASVERSPAESAAHVETFDPIASLLAVLVVTLIVVRWLVPAESAFDGDTLWIVQLWLAAGVVWAWGCLRNGRFALRLGAFDAALWTVIAGHVLSTAVLFFQGGDRRAALNITWEWIGVGATFFLLRQFVPAIGTEETSGAAKGARADNRLVTIVATLGVVFAGLGIWQHYVYYPRAYEEYREMLSELETLRKNPVANAQRIGRAELKLQAQGVPSDEAGRRQFENRLRFSNEPFGPFALANTFAGFLVVALILAADLFRGARRALATGRSSNGSLSKTFIAAWAAVFLLLVYCLVLTKSRTAWIALVAALAFWGACSLFRSRKLLGRRSLLVAAAVGGLVAAAIVVLFVVAALGGGFDLKVISEAPKSFTYRLQYWSGALKVVRDNPIFGIGPGNFRQHYLHYKLPESSEEIADPHNLILDLWTSGGLLAVGGFFGCLAFAVRPFLRRQSESEESASPSSPALWTALLPGATAGFLLGILAPVLAGAGDYDVWQIALFAGWLITFFVLRGNLVAARLSAAALGGAGFGLLVHLLDLGGIEMPAVVQLFLVIVVSAFSLLPERRQTWESPKCVIAIGATALVLFIGCLMTAMIPVLNRRALVGAGEQALMSDGDADRAIRDFGDAARRDPFSPEPAEKLTDVFFSRWQAAKPDAAIDYFAKAKQSLDLAISLDRFNPRLYRRLGEMYSAKFARSKDRSDAQAAADALTQAVARYPNESSLDGLLANALAAAGQPEAAKAEAQRALQLDQINRKFEHTDRYLPDATLIELQRLAKPAAH